jgi:branched-chain amino acid transport system ATP-binding protein
LSLLELHDVRVRDVLHGISLAVENGEFLAIVGPNGSGKTTLLNAISGLVATSGVVRVDERRLFRRSPEGLARLGVASVPAGRGTLATLSVLDNLRLGAWTQRGTASGRDLARVFQVYPHLYERRGQRAGRLSAADQQMLALGRVMMARPRLVLLDEPSYGLAPLVTREIFRTLSEMNDGGTALLVAERDAPAIRAVAQRVAVLDLGRLVDDHGR